MLSLLLLLLLEVHLVDFIALELYFPLLVLQEVDHLVAPIFIEGIQNSKVAEQLVVSCLDAYLGVAEYQIVGVV